MFREFPMFIACWSVGLLMILLPSLIVKLFGKEIDEENGGDNYEN